MICVPFILSINDSNCYGLKLRHTFMEPNITFLLLLAKVVLKCGGVLIHKLTVATSKWIVLNHYAPVIVSLAIEYEQKSTKQKTLTHTLLLSWFQLGSLYCKKNFFLVLCCFFLSLCFNLFHPKLIQMINILSLQFQKF